MADEIVLPPSYESREAHKRITAGLVSKGTLPTLARRATREALLEAPFDDVDLEGWTTACKRAREIANALTIGAEFVSIIPEG